VVTVKVGAARRVPCYQEKKDGLSLTIRVQPRASVEMLEMTAGGELPARTTAPPVDSAANDAVAALLARVFGVAKSRVKLQFGAHARTKVFLVEGRSGELLEALRAHLGDVMA
jgi:uncharacterized protein YggU (UPF0235/DUF167 family)